MPTALLPGAPAPSPAGGTGEPRHAGDAAGRQLGASASQTSNPLLLQPMAAVSSRDPRKSILNKHWITFQYNAGVSEFNAFNPLTILEVSKGGKGQHAWGSTRSPR